MKRFYLILIGMLGIILLLSCNSANNDNTLTESIEKDSLDRSLKKAVVFRVKLFARGKIHRNYGAVLLDNGDKLRFVLNHSEVEDWLFLEKGDTVVYQNDKLIDICWKEEKSSY